MLWWCTATTALLARPRHHRSSGRSSVNRLCLCRRGRDPDRRRAQLRNHVQVRVQPTTRGALNESAAQWQHPNQVVRGLRISPILGRRPSAPQPPRAAKNAKNFGRLAEATRAGAADSRSSSAAPWLGESSTPPARWRGTLARRIATCASWAARCARSLPLKCELAAGCAEYAGPCGVVARPRCPLIRLTSCTCAYGSQASNAGALASLRRSRPPLLAPSA